MQIKKSLTPDPSPNGEGSENYYLQMKESLTPNPSPNGEGSENYCLQVKRAHLKIKGGVSLMQGEALLDIRKRPSPIEMGVSFNSRI